MHDLVEVTESGFYCRQGDFFIDPWRPVARAIITHAHADHARRGCGRYLCASSGKLVLRGRMGGNAPIDVLRHGDSLLVNGVRVSLHPAGHVLGSAQVRLEHGGTIWVVTGDYKLDPDPTCAAFETVRCDVLVTESTFGLPVYRWPSSVTIAADLDRWWRGNRDAGRTSVLLAYALGKAQRLAALVDPGIGPIVAHGAVMTMVEAYRASGVRLPPIDRVPPRARRVGGGRALVIAPPSVLGGSWLRLFGESSIAMASGWMTLRGVRRRRGFATGFVVSDHADFPGLLAAIEASGARRVLVTHGFAEPLARLLRERGLDATPLTTRFTGEASPDAAVGDDGDGDASPAEAATPADGSVPDRGASAADVAEAAVE